MQNNEQKVSPDGDRCAKAVTDVSMQQVTPAQIKNAAAALANLMRSHEGSGSKMRPSALSTFLSLPKPAVVDASQSDDESEDVESVGEEDVDKSRFLLSSKSLRSTESGHLDPETRARLRALLESTGLGKLSTADSKALADPEVLRRLTDKVNSAMDEAASTLMRIKAEQQKGSGSAPASGNTGACAAGSSSDIDVVHLTLEDGQLCPAELEQALEGDSLLLMACSAGYYQLAEALLALKSDVEDRGTKGDRTPLMEAACGGYLDIVRLLIAHKADVNAQAPSGNTALHYAACSGYVDVARELLVAGARVEEPNENGHTPLMEAATAGQVEIAALLLANGANINTHSTEFKESALTLACYKGHLEMVKFLLEKGADLEHKTDEMHTALMEASMDGHVDVARLLLDRGAQVNMPADSFESPLTLAACGGHTELASLLIERGASLEEVNDEGYTPLMEAVREGHEDMVTLLIHRGADVNAQTEETQETALTLACCGGFLEIAELLVNSGANLELGCSTPLMEAAQEGHVELVKYLIGAGAQVNAQTFTKGTALTYACENGHTEVAEILVQHGADIDHESEGGRTALMRAAKNGHLRTAEFLVSKGACVNKVTTNNDHTVLSVACANGHLHVVEFLLCAGADFTHKLKDGSTMLIEAAKGGHCDIMNLLLDWPTSGAKVAAAGVAAGIEAAVQLNKLSHDASVTAAAGGAGDAAAKAAAAAAQRNMMAAVRDAPDGVMVQAKSGAAADGGGTAAAQNVGAGNAAAEPATPDDGSWEAFVGKMATKGELLGLDREEQIVVKQQMLDRLMQLERELQERTMQSGKASVSAEDVSKMHAEDIAAAAATRNRFVVVDDHLRGDEELAIAILEKAVLGETVLDRVVLEQLKAYIRGSGGDAALLEGAQATTEGSQSPGSSRAPSGDGSGDFVRDLDNSSVSSSSSEEGEKFEDAYGDEGGPEAAAGTADSSTEVTAATILPQLDRVEKHVTPPVRRTFEQSAKDTMNAGQLPRSPADGGDVVTHVPQQAKAKDRAKVQRRLAKPQSTAGAVSPAPASKAVAATAQQQSEVERNATLQQQRQQLQAQLALQQQLHDELQQHLKLQQEHQQLQAQLKVKEAVQSPANDGVTQGKATGPLLLPPDHQCCHHQHPCPQQRQHVQQQLRQLQHQLQQAAGQTNIDSLQQAQQQAKHLALLHQKHSSLAAASTITQSTQTSSAAAPAVTETAAATVQQQQQQQQQPTGTKSIHIPLTGNAAALAAQKKAADLAAQANRQRQPAGNNQNRTGVAAPCPNCCVDAAKQQQAATAAAATGNTARPPAPGAAAAPIDVNAETDSNHDTALTLAAAGGHARLVTLLLSRGANVEHRDKKGLSPLILAAAAGHVEVCEVLTAHKAEVDGVSDKNKDTALSLACSNGRLEVVELLLSKGANKEHRNISDYTPLSQAASGGYVNVIKVLLAHGAEINSRTGSKMGISPLMLAAMNGHTAAVKLLLDMGSDINAQIETNRNTALTLACFQGRYEVVSLLIDRKANIEHRAKTGLTPLMEAASGGYVEVGRVLLDKGADIAAAPVPVSRDTALTIAADKGHHRFVELLLSRGAAVDVKNKKGNTPLWLACNGGHVEVVQLLVAAGADVHSEDHRRVSCIMAAFRKAHIKVVKVLVRHVTQFPPDQDCLRYIATLTDKEMVKRCHQCMTLIVTAKEQQAAEANKNAAILLEELSLEREREETKRAAAARKRDRKKLKKKEKADRDKDLPDGTSGSLDNGDGDDMDGEDVPTTFEKRPSVLENGLLDDRDIMLLTAANPSSSSGNNANAKDLLPADVATKNAKNDAPATAAVVSTGDVGSASPQDGQRRNRRSRRDRQKNDASGNNPEDRKPVLSTDGAIKSTSVPAAFNGDPLPVVTPVASAAAASCTLALSSVPAGTAVKVKPTAVVTGAPAVINRDAHRDVFVEPPIKPAIIPLMSIQASSLTGIGDLDDFGSLSITPGMQMKSSSMKKPQAMEKPRITLVEQKGPLPVKRGTVAQSRSNTKKGQRRDDDWEEVSRKSKRLLVPANAISRVIGRGGCNINAIRDISTAQVEIDRSRDSTTERIITIKGSVEATRYAQTLIEALINDTEKKFEQQLSKMKPLQATSGSGQKQKSAVAAAMIKSALNGGASAATKDDLLRAKRPVVPLSSFPISAWGQPPQSRSGNLAASSSGTVTAATAWNGADSQARASPDTVNMSYNDRAKFATAVGMSVAVTASLQDSGAMQSWSPVNERMPDASPVATSASAVTPLMSTPVRSEQQPLPIVTSAGFPSVSTTRFNVAPPTTGVMRDYSPFNNVLSQIAESVLAKRPDDFASVAAAGIVMNASPPLPNQYQEDSQMQQGSGLGSDPHKAPGYKPPTCTDPSKAPGHRAGAQTARNAMTAVSSAGNTTESMGVFRQPEYIGRPSSTPTAVAHSPLIGDEMENGGPRGRALGASLDRPASFYGGTNFMSGVPVNFSQPPPGLLQFGSSTGPNQDTFAPPLMHQFGGGSHGCLASAVSETSVLAAPLMATSVASVSQPGCIGSQLVMPTLASAPSTAGYACLPENSYADVTNQSPVVASEPGTGAGAAGMMEDRKTLGPIGTERAARRPPQPVMQTPSYQHGFGLPLHSEPPPSMWPFNADAGWNQLPQMFGATLADQSAMLAAAAAGFHMDDSLLRSHQSGLHMGYQPHSLGDMNAATAAMMMSDMYPIDPSLAIDQATMQQMLHANQQAMMMPSMFAGADMSAAYGGMVGGQVPATGYPSLGNTAGFVMNSEDTGNAWSTSAAAPDFQQHYLGPKGPQMMWNQSSWTPSANM